MDEELLKAVHPEKAEIEDALFGAYDECADSRERIGMEARALRATMRAWLEKVTHEVREAEAMLEELEGWTAGARLPDFAGQLVDAVSSTEGRHSTPDTGFDDLMFYLILEAAGHERPEYAHIIDLEEMCRPVLREWAARVARTIVLQSEVGFGDGASPRHVQDALRDAFIGALRRPKAQPTENDAPAEAEAAE